MSVIVDLQSKVKIGVTNKHRDNLTDDVVNTLVEEVIAERTSKLVAAYKKIQVLQKELNKFKPDIEGTFDSDGNEVTPATFSGKLVKQVKDKKGEISKLETAIEKAVTEADFGQLNNLVK